MRVQAILVTQIKSVLAVMLFVGLTLGGIGAGVGLSTGRQPAQKEQQPAKTDEERMIGSWTIVNDDSKRKGEVWEIGKHQIVSHALVKVVKGTKLHSRFHRLDAGKNPKHIDITLTEVGSSVIGPDVPIDRNAQTVGVIKGIYSFKGDELRFCLAPIDKDRPAKFPEKPEPGEVLILQRQTPGGEQPKAKEKLPAEKTSTAASKFDAVILVKAKEPDSSSLYVVLTQSRADLDPTAYHDKLCELVVKQSKAAIQVATEHKFQGTTKANELPKHQGNVVFLVRVSAKALDGYSTGFTVEQLREIAAASPEEGERLVRVHAWALFGKIPAQK